MQLSEEEKEVLLLAARDAIRSHFGESLPPVIDYSRFPQLQEINLGAFVTLKIRDDLRGCIGYLESPNMTLFNTICKAARHAAFNDPRFHPLSIRELPDIIIEISILSAFKLINNYEEIEPGVHGLLLDEPRTRALLLPQVATENNFDLQEFLSAICQKGGIDSNTWEKRKLNLKVFTALVFSESAEKKKTYESA